ncbi:MAG TPA: ABC transporter permease, partial [Thermodesulfovibrionales bacterium]|nr:ABC transporter permease [Thermodesulfovibrionales bacterium]
MGKRVTQMILKEFIQTLRDKRRWMLLFGAPILQLFIFGYVVTTDVNHVSTALYDLDKSQESRELARRLEASGYFTIRFAPRSPRELRDLIDRGEVMCAIQMNRGFAKNLKKRIPAEIQVIVDGTDSNTAMVALSHVTKVIAKYAGEYTVKTSGMVLSPPDFRTRVWYNPDLKSRNFNVPGVIASIIMITCIMLTSMAIVREREVGTMEQLMVTPIRPVELMLGKTIPFAVIGFLDMFMVTLAGVLWFGI